MKFSLVLAFVICVAGCSSAAKPVAQNMVPANASSSEKPQTAIAHSSENQTPSPSNPSGKWSASGDAIETKEFDAAIVSAEKAVASKPSDASAKKALSGAFYRRGVALTEARQYASALGDYRRAIKNDPESADAKEWIDKIVMIYGSLKREPPKEGEEPPPLPFKK